MKVLTRELGPHLDKPEVRRTVARAMAFYEVPAQQSRDIQVQLVPLPLDWTGPFSGEQIEHLAVIEFKTAPAVQPRTAPAVTPAASSCTSCFTTSTVGPGEKAAGPGGGLRLLPGSGRAAAYGLITEALATVFSVHGRKAYLTAEEYQAELASGRPWYGTPPSTRRRGPRCQRWTRCWRRENALRRPLRPRIREGASDRNGRGAGPPGAEAADAAAGGRGSRLRPVIQAIQRAQAAGGADGHPAGAVGDAEKLAEAPGGQRGAGGAGRKSAKAARLRGGAGQGDRRESWRPCGSNDGHSSRR